MSPITPSKVFFFFFGVTVVQSKHLKERSSCNPHPHLLLSLLQLPHLLFSSSFPPPLPAPTSPPPHLFLLIFYATTSSSSFSHHPLLSSPAPQCPQRLPCSSSSTPSPPPPHLLLFSASSSFSLPPLLPPLHLLVFSPSHCSPAVPSSGGTRSAFLPVLEANLAPPSPRRLVLLLLYLLFLIFSSSSSSPFSPPPPPRSSSSPLPTGLQQFPPLVELTQLFSLSSKGALLLALLLTLLLALLLALLLCLRCAALTFKGLAWPRAAPCHALGPEMPSPTSTALSSGAGWVSTISSAELRHATRKMDRV